MSTRTGSLDFGSRSSIENVILDNRTTDPSVVAAGLFYYNTVTGYIRYCNGGAWMNVEHQSNRVNVWSDVPSTIKYPSEKLTKESLDTISLALSTHNHNLNDLAEKSYDSLTDKPSLNFEPADANIQLHIGDGNIHVTKIKTAAWDAKLDVSTVIPSLNTIDKRLTPAINEVNAIAKGAGNGETITDIEALVILLNAAVPTDYPYGKNFYIVDTEVPDYWISAIGSSSVPYTYVDDTTFLDDIAVTGSLQVGYYSISELEGQKVDLTDYYDKSAADLLLGAKANLSGGNSISGNQNFDSNTLFVDSVNHRVGIGTANPAYTLSLKDASTLNFIGATTDGIIQWNDYNWQLQGRTFNTSFTRSLVTGRVMALTSGSATTEGFAFGRNGGSSIMEVKNDGLIYFNGSVGIGTTTPATKLDVNGTSNFADNMNILSTKNQYLAASPTSDTVNDIRVRNDSGVLKTERCTVANATKGAGTWVDESKADITPANGSTSALRALFTSVPRANCVYNTNTGYYEMNGITDLTEADMMKSYHFLYAYKNTASAGAYQGSGIRTNYYLGINSNATYNYQYCFQNETTLEVFRLYIYNSIGNMEGMFYGCTNLIKAETFRMTSLINASWVLNTFYNCIKLETVYLYELKISFSFAWSPLLSLESLQYLVNNRANGNNQIAITVHADVWAKLDDATHYPTWNALLVEAGTKYIALASAES